MGSHLEGGWIATGVCLRPKNPRVLMLCEPRHCFGVESLGYSVGRETVTSKGTLDVKRKS